ncbi:hypothetical protein [Desulfosarcina ovata]|uniref:DUF86 domain-containing protein n=1 Tax=Desulfosarcina ovata subsp. ovata TaxID=2752305 RepID=A0A5K8A5H8_9BACT|nr:hypothetical protein [Desulfosarcina ovata]BBO87638.1 hypothetical protein DSCOOX_08180 [Desulfosarcina ovata subsp. ovata]
MKNVKAAMQEELKELNNACEVLAYSYEKCARIGVQSGLSNEALESFEALTGRFARLSDIVIQKIFRYFDVLELEAPGTVRDRINRAEKKGLIDNAEDFIQIRLLRNEIAHEYKSETIYRIFESVLELAPVLLKSVDQIISYSKRYVDCK